MNTTFLERFEAAARTHASRIAIEIDGVTQWTYERLCQRVDAFAAAILRQQPPRGSIIAITLDKSAEYIASLIAVWKVGCIAMPLPPSIPIRRRKECIRRSKAAFTIDGDWVASADRQLLNPLACLADLATVTSSDPSYVFFTSGSTGRPKGVLVSHAGLVPMLEAQVAMFRIDQRTRSFFYLSTAFDASLSDIGTCLLAGGTLVIESDLHQLSVGDLFERMKERRITYSDLPPSVMTHAAEMKLEAPSDLVTIVVGGETCPLPTLKWWSSRVRLINVYGPTEATVCTSMELCEHDRLDADPTIGQPIPSIKYRLEPVADCEESAHELWIGGPAVAVGYLADETLTRDRFVLSNGCRWYRTGDLVERDSHGRWIFRGRMDRQFKLLGRLVEPAEIEIRLHEIKGVAAAHVLPLGEPYPKSIGCLLELHPGHSLQCRELTGILRQGLPEWMVPRHFHIVDQIPRTASGKVDSSAALAFVALDQIEAPIPDELNTAARQLRSAWMETLRLQTVGWDDDFFLLGGDSIAALRLVARCELDGIRLTTTTLLRERTIRGCLQADAGGAARSTDDLQNEVEEMLPGCRPQMKLVDGKLMKSVAGKPVSGKPLKQRHVLLTGATGFLGTNVLDAMRADPWCQVTCLVRAENQLTALRRLKQSRDRYLGDSGRYHTRGEVHVICGDVSRPQWGLGEADWTRLASDVTDVMHLAANVNMVKTCQELRGDNVQGVATAIRFARSGALKSLWYASSLSVFVATDRQACRFDENDGLTAETNVHGGYGQSKWVGERLVNHHKSQIPLGVIRLGLLTRESGSCGESTDQLSLFTRGIAELGVYPRASEGMSFDLTPVDYAAHAIHDLAKRSETGVVHVCGERPVTLKEWVESLQALGVEMRAVSTEEFDRKTRESLVRQGPHAAAATCLALRRRLTAEYEGSHHREHDLFLTTNTSFDTARADKCLERLIWRRQIDRERLKRIVAATGVVAKVKQR